MKFPPSWQKGKRMLQDGQQIIAVLRNSSDPEGETQIPMIITQMEGTQLDLKLQFENPQYVSLVSQNELDDIVFKYPKDLVLTDMDDNPLIIDKASDSKDSLDVAIQI